MPCNEFIEMRVILSVKYCALGINSSINFEKSAIFESRKKKLSIAKVFSCMQSKFRVVNTARVAVLLCKWARQ